MKLKNQARKKMIEFLFNKEFSLIVIGCLIMGVGMYINDWRSKKREERQARLNSIRFPK